MQKTFNCEKEKKKGEVGTLASPGVMDGLR